VTGCGHGPPVGPPAGGGMERGTAAGKLQEAAAGILRRAVQLQPSAPAGVQMEEHLAGTSKINYYIN